MKDAIEKLERLAVMLDSVGLIAETYRLQAEYDGLRAAGAMPPSEFFDESPADADKASAQVKEAMEHCKAVLGEALDILRPPPTA